MKLVYLIQDLASPGGTIRVLHNKVCWFVRQGGYEITIITTDQRHLPLYYDFPKEVQIIDLNINYSSVYTEPPLKRLFATTQKKRAHFKKLSELLYKIQPDITITFYPIDMCRIYRINDGSKKVIEFHSSRYLRLSRGYRGIHHLVAIFRTWQDSRFVKGFDKLVVLTEEGARQWKSYKNTVVIPNAVTSFPEISPKPASKRVIAVGRLVYEKGFDRLIKAWSILPEEILSEWNLTILGSGEQQSILNELITSLGITSSVHISAPTKKIFEEYAKSDFLVMTSYSEGLPMVLIEAMSCGLPAICFDFPCGPKDLIEDGINGFLVENNNIRLLAEKIELLIRNQNLRLKFSENARQIKDKFSEERIMALWTAFFSDVSSEN